MAISEAKSISVNGVIWHYQEFTGNEYAVRLYDENGDFVIEFSDFGEMVRFVHNRIRSGL